MSSPSQFQIIPNFLVLISNFGGLASSDQSSFVDHHIKMIGKFASVRPVRVTFLNI